MQKILSTKLWNEGLKARMIPVPSQYAVAGEQQEHQATLTEAPTSRAESVWGGKPWKTNVVELEGEILCSVY